MIMAKPVFQLTIEDLTSLGHMGSSSTVLSRRLFSTELKAKKFAEADYKARQERHEVMSGGRPPFHNTTFKWCNQSTYITSGDLGYIMYSVHAQPVL